jgi:phosphatidylserine/phosphatidylglycerophosphate/cardiolipin synthase-like enzyme
MVAMVVWNQPASSTWIPFTPSLLVKPSETHAIDLRHGQVDITFDVKLDWIQTAENYIDIEMWNMWDYDTGPVRKLYDALIEANNRGVVIRILLDRDHYLSGDSVAEELDPYPNIIVLPSRTSGTHSKYMIVDEWRVTVGSTNWSWSAMVQNREFNLSIENRDVGLAFTYLFEAAWAAAGGENLRGTGKYWSSDVLEPLAHDDDVPAEFRAIYEYTTQQIDAAENEILISLYHYDPFDSDIKREFQERLIAAAERGVIVKLVINYNSYYNPERTIIDDLASRPNTYVKIIDIRTAPPWDDYGHSHPKIFLVDGYKGTVSSMNWDKYVFDNAGRDVGVAFSNTTLASLIKECFYYTWNAPDTYWADGQDPIPPSDITAPAVNTISVENITATSATFKGELLDDGGSDKVNVYFLYQATPEDEYWDYYHPIERVPDPTLFQYTVEDLQPNTEYVVVAQASNEADRIRGVKIYFTTENLPPPPPPENEQVSNGLFDGEANWTKTIVTSVTDPIDRTIVEATYDPENSTDVGTGSVKVRASAYLYSAIAHMEAYWEQSIGPISSGTTVTVNGEFRKSIVQSGGTASIDTATVRIDVYDGTSWVTVVNNTDKSGYGWTPFPESTYTVTNEITKIRVYMDAAVSLGNGRNQEATVVLWMDNISLKT